MVLGNFRGFKMILVAGENILRRYWRDASKNYKLLLASAHSGTAGRF